MRGDRERLVQRVGRVASAAIGSLPGGTSQVAGGLVVYCAGCRLAVGDRVAEVAQTASESFAGQPFLGCFPLGEQGVLLDRYVHANLMIRTEEHKSELQSPMRDSDRVLWFKK